MLSLGKVIFLAVLLRWFDTIDGGGAVNNSKRPFDLKKFDNHTNEQTHSIAPQRTIKISEAIP